MKLKALAFTLSLIASLHVSCVMDHAERVYAAHPPSIHPAVVLTSIPQEPYEVIADVQWEGGTVKKMAARAAQLGGDAVIIQLLGGNVYLSSLSPEEMNRSSSTFNRMAGTVIKYKRK